MIFTEATIKQCDDVYKVVQQTIWKVYPRYYPPEVVEFFSKLHSKDDIRRDIEDKNVGILLDEGNRIVGTGTRKENHIVRVFVLPEYQGKGYGSKIIEELEEQIAKTYSSACVDASLPASRFYEKRHYITTNHEHIDVESDIALVYEMMEKQFVGNFVHKSDIHYNGKIFVPESNTENGEVDEQTLFYYHQDGSTFWADYSGGDIVKGNMVGTVSETGELDFHYQHLNLEGQIRIGKCHSIPKLLADGRLHMSEQWQWLNGDNSSGESVVVELLKRY